MTGGERSCALLRYGDGLKTISVFEEASRPGDDLAERQETLRKDMARYGQQAWVCGDPKLCITVLGDAALPDSLGQDLLRAFDPEGEARLARGLARDFGDLSGAERQRRRGWDYAQIVALRLYGRATRNVKPPSPTACTRPGVAADRGRPARRPGAAGGRRPPLDRRHVDCSTHT